jgi:outer membrane protein OmpA-like peptidoglycan-associated protein
VRRFHVSSALAEANVKQATTVSRRITLALLLILVPSVVLGDSPAGPSMVLFESGSSQISLAGRAVIDDFLGWQKGYDSSRPPKILLKCYADRVGSELYNLALSNDRCVAVRDLLLRAGVRLDTIILSPRGEFEWKVPTPDGVPEQANRLVSVDFVN